MPDPTHGRIDPDIQAAVDAWNPSSLGQRVAIENTLQRRRDGGEELSLVPTEHEGPKAGGAAATASPADPFTREEWDAINAAIWTDLEDDPFRFSDLLTVALGTLAGMALDADVGPHEAGYVALAVRVLREMEQRALWGPDHEQEDHR